MRKLFFVLAAFLLIMPVVLAANDCDTKTSLASEILNTRYLFLKYRAEERRISMDAVIAKFDENNLDSTELKSIEDDFKALYDKAKSAADAADRQAFDDTVKEGKDIIKSFKDTVHEQNITGLGLPQAIKAELDKNKDYLQGLHDDAVASKKNTYLKIFDARICHHQNAIDKLSEKNVDVTELQSDLDAIEAKRDDLSSKIDSAEASCDVPINACTTAEADAVVALHREIEDDFRALNAKILETIKQKISEIRSKLGKGSNNTGVAP